MSKIFVVLLTTVIVTTKCETNGTSEEPESEGFSRDVLLPRIVGGFNCDPRLVPYLASIQTLGHAVFCGGSLIHPNWALTAAHCCSPSYTDYSVHTGLSKLSRATNIQSSPVKRMIAHEEFKTHPWGSDICLLELENPLHENEHTKYVRLPTPDVFEQLMNETRCNMSLAMGFGYRSIVHEDGTAEPNSQNPLLQCVFQRVMNEEYCSNGTASVDLTTTLCTHGNPAVTADTCQGDSGGPLLCQGYQVGVVAAGLGCGLGHRSYYTKATLKGRRAVSCGGSLISPHWVLTAAHCCTPRIKKKSTQVTTGMHTLRNSYIQTSSIVRVISHPDFRKSPWGSDICLLELEEPLSENKHTKYVPLATKEIYEKFIREKKCNKSLAMGFGRLNTVYEDGSYDPAPKTTTLQCVFQRVMSDQYCSESVALIDLDTILCTHGNPSVHADTCQGDSGGPLVCEGYQIGLVAAGLGCGLGYPSYFTKIAPFYDSFISKYVPELKRKRTALEIDYASTFIPFHLRYIVSFAIFTTYCA